MASAARGVMVWDLPVRLFHGALALLVVFSFITGKVGGSWLEWHMRSGYSILALLAFRLAWGFVGSDTARFAGFVRGPRAVLAHLQALRRRRPVPQPGHNPLGGWMILLMLAALAVQAAAGLFADDEIATRGPLAVKVSEALVGWMTRVHYYGGWLIAGLVGLHLLAVGTYQWALRVNLIGPILHGRMPLERVARSPRMASTWLAAALLAAAGAAVYWLVVVFPRAAA